MKVGYRITISVLAILGGILLFRWLIGGSTVTLFMPAGVIAAEQGSLIIKEVLLMLIVAIPMFALLFFAAWKYRSDAKADYMPDWHGEKSQLVLWAIPITLIAVLSVLNWQSAHLLDPYRPIPSSEPPITINVVALPWKWLFI